MSDNSYFNPQTQLTFSKGYDVLLSMGVLSATGTNGAYGAASAANIATFTDSTASAFTAAMVGQTITVAGGSQNGTYQIVAFVSSSVIDVYAPGVTLDSGPYTWSIYPDPTIIAGDINEAYVTVKRIGKGTYCLTTVDPFPYFVGITGSTHIPGNAGLVAGFISPLSPVQNIGGFNPYLTGVSEPVNSISVAFGTCDTSLRDIVPYTSTGTNGVMTAGLSGVPYTKFVDSSASGFSQASVGGTITITGASAASNNGTFGIVGYISPSTVLIANPLGVAATGLSWSQSIPALVSIHMVLNNGPVQ